MRTYQTELFTALSILYPDSEHVKTLGLINTDDVVIWEHARRPYRVWKMVAVERNGRSRNDFV